MMLAHAVKSLMESLPGQQWEYGLCRYCTNAGGDDHSDGCPWLAVEKALDREKEVQDKLRAVVENYETLIEGDTDDYSLNQWRNALATILDAAREAVK